MHIRERTVRTEMQRAALYNTLSGMLDALAEAEGVPVATMSQTLVEYSTLSLRVEGAEFDFELAQHGDDADTLRRKVAAYLDSGQVDAIEEALAAIRKHDRGPEVTGPEPPDDPK